MEKKKLDYKWVILAVCFLMVFICLGFCSSNKGRYLGAIEAATGIERTFLSVNDSFRFGVSALINFFFGALVVKFGVRKLVPVGFGLLIGAVSCYAGADAFAKLFASEGNGYLIAFLSMFYLGGTLLGIGLAFTTTAMASIMVKRWFTGNTGTVLGVVLAANGLGGALAAQIVGPIIDSDKFGYAKAYTIVAIILLVMGVLATVLLREKPKDFAGELLVKNKKKARGGGWIGMDFSAAKRIGYFIPACVGIFLTGMVLSGINGIGSTHLKNDVGLPGRYVDTVMSVHSLVLMGTKMLAGVVYDKKGLRTTMLMCNGVGVVSMILLALVAPTPTGMLLAMIWGVTSAIALPMETIGVTLVASDLFGNKDFDKILGIMLALNHAGYAVGSIVVNAVRKLFGGADYSEAALLFAGILLAVTLMYQFIITAAHKTRKNIEAEEALR